MYSSSEDRGSEIYKIHFDFLWSSEILQHTRVRNPAFCFHPFLETVINSQVHFNYNGPSNCNLWDISSLSKNMQVHTKLRINNNMHKGINWRRFCIIKNVTPYRRKDHDNAYWALYYLWSFLLLLFYPRTLCCVHKDHKEAAECAKTTTVAGWNVRYMWHWS